METLNRHPSIWLCAETYFLHFVYGRRHRLGDLANPSVRRKLISAYLQTNRIKQQNVDLDELAETLMDEGVGYEAFFDSLMRFCARQHGKRRYGEKTPDHARAADVLCRAFPDCALIHLVRDPRDVVASLMRMPWGDKSVLANAGQWRACQMGALRCSGRQNYLQVVFESLVARPEKELSRICRFLGEEYSPEMLIAGEEEGASRWWLKRARRSIDQTRAHSWRQELTSTQVGLVEWRVGGLMERLGYAAEARPVPRMRIAQALAMESLDRARWTLKRLPGMWYYWLRPGDLASEEATIDALA
jgi:hypothetical protein